MQAAQQSTADDPVAIEALTRVLHQWFLGFQLMVSTRCGAQVVGDWMFRLFRRQHEAKFLSSFAKLGLEGLPHAVACARYHVLSNGIGGVAVEYMEESPRKAWVRFRYPRWMFDGPTLCGMPIEASRGFLRGWYAHNGVSLNNPRLGFVCVSEDMSGEFGLCGYFLEHEHDLAPEERLRFARGERPPPWDPARQPQPPAALWDAQRLRHAARNYALEYLRNGLIALAEGIGAPRALELASLSARLTGMQTWHAAAQSLGEDDGGADSAARYLMRMLAASGDTVALEPGADAHHALLHQHGLSALRGLDPDQRELFWQAWRELWRGAVNAYRSLPTLELEADPRADRAWARWRLSLPAHPQIR